jgi:NADPH-dependent ferric siderophore reductase
MRPGVSYRVDDGGGKAKTWLVQHQGLWFAHQHTLDRQHLALVAGHGAGTLAAPLREFRKNCINPFQQRCYPRTVRERRRAEQEIALDALLHEHRLRRRRFIAGSSKTQ